MIHLDLGHFMKLAHIAAVLSRTIQNRLASQRV